MTSAFANVSNIYCMKKRNIHLLNVVTGTILTKATGVLGSQRSPLVRCNHFTPTAVTGTSSITHVHLLAAELTVQYCSDGERAQHRGTQEEDNSSTSLWSFWPVLLTSSPPPPRLQHSRWSTLNLDDGFKIPMYRVKTCLS